MTWKLFSSLANRQLGFFTAQQTYAVESSMTSVGVVEVECG